MRTNRRETGIAAVGTVPLGTHFCKIYETKQDLLNVLVPYFKAGLEGNEYCIWITSDVLTPKQAQDALRQAVPNLDIYLKAGQLEIIPHTEWYLKGGHFDPDRVSNAWFAKMDAATESGYEGTRATGDASWLCDVTRTAFYDYEAFIESVVAELPVVILCTYPAGHCSCVGQADILANHQVAMVGRNGWERIWENIEYRHTQRELSKVTERLELLSGITTSLLTTDDPKPLIQSLAEKVMNHLGCDVFFNYLAVPGEDYLELNAFAGISEDEASQIRKLDYGEAVRGLVGATGEEIVLSNVQELADPRAALVESLGVRTYACTPLLSHHGALLGTLSLGSRSRSSFTPDEIELIQNVSRRVGSALEREGTEHALRESERRFRSLFDYSPDAVFLTRPEGIITAANPAACAMFGMTEEEICRVGRVGLADPDDLRHLEVIEERKRTGSFTNAELRYIRKNGERFVAEVSSVVMNGDGNEAFVIMRDITERKRAEVALRQTEERLARTQQFSMVMPLYVSLDGRWLKLPRSFVEFLGYNTEEELLGREFREFTHPDDFWADWSQVQRLIAGEMKSFELAKRFIRKDGSITWGYMNCSIVTDEQGKPVHLLTYVRDINEEMRVEREREDLLRREHRIAETLQQALVPPNIPSKVGDYRIAAKYKSALKEAEVGGDFYDVFDLGNDKIAVLIGDVVGKGLSAAIRVAAARYSIRGYAYLDPRPERVLELANNSLCKDKTEDEAGMLTAFLAIFDTQVGGVSYAVAGHEPPVLISPNGKIVELSGRGMPLGVMPNATYQGKSCRLNVGDRIVMVTDGITEARAEGPVLFEKHRVIECLEQTRTNSPEDTAGCLLNRATEHAGGQLQDDAAIIVVDWVPDI